MSKKNSLETLEILREIRAKVQDNTENSADVDKIDKLIKELEAENSVNPQYLLALLGKCIEYASVMKTLYDLFNNG